MTSVSVTFIRVTHTFPERSELVAAERYEKKNPTGRGTLVRRQPWRTWSKTKMRNLQGLDIRALHGQDHRHSKFSRAERLSARSEEERNVIVCGQSSPHLDYTYGQRQNTVRGKDQKNEVLPNVDKNLWLVENLWTSTSTVHANDVRTICN